MKKKLITLFVFLITITLFSITNIKAKQVYELNSDFKNTDYPLLNEKINNEINNFIKDFEKDLCDDLNYYINITHETYNYKNYISYVFHIEYYEGGAHPNHKLLTFIYDKDSNSIIDIDTLLKEDPNILKEFSDISRIKLLYNSRIIDTNIMLEGTKPTKENFSNFIYSKDGIIIFFEYYQVAPYSQGEFSIIIPYGKIHISF